MNPSRSHNNEAAIQSDSSIPLVGTIIPILSYGSWEPSLGEKL
jgi:hypothetical protein